MRSKTKLRQQSLSGAKLAERHATLLQSLLLQSEAEDDHLVFPRWQVALLGFFVGVAGLDEFQGQDRDAGAGA